MKNKVQGGPKKGGSVHITTPGEISFIVNSTTLQHFFHSSVPNFSMNSSIIFGISSMCDPLSFFLHPRCGSLIKLFRPNVFPLADSPLCYLGDFSHAYHLRNDCNVEHNPTCFFCSLSHPKYSFHLGNMKEFNVTWNYHV